MAQVGQQHPIGIYLKIWVLLFILSGFSYMVDILHLEGYLRWSLILLFMPFIPDARIALLKEISPLLYLSLSGVVGAYMGFTQMGDKK